MHHPFLFAIIALFDSQLQITRRLCSLSIERLNVQTPRCLATISFSSSFLHYFTKQSKKPKIFSFVVQFQRRKPNSILQYKGCRGLKDPRRPTEPSDLLDFEVAARLRQHT